jgi:hypothetical protein
MPEVIRSEEFPPCLSANRRDKDGPPTTSGWCGRRSHPKLPQVVIQVNISQTHPLRLGHPAKMGMKWPLEVSGLARESDPRGF